MPIPDEAVALGGRGRGQLRRQRLTGQRVPLPEIFGFGDAPPGISLGDTQPVGQRAAQRAAQLLLAGSCAELVDDAVLRCAGAAGDAFEALEGPHQFRSRQHVKRQLTQAVQVGVERVEDLYDLFATTATHAQILRRATDTNAAIVTIEAKVAQGITVPAAQWKRCSERPLRKR